MTMSMMAGIMFFIIVLQSATPFLLKRNSAFGVTIPEGHTKEPIVQSFKRNYSVAVVVVGMGLMLTYVLWSRSGQLADEQIALAGMAIQIGILLISMGLYLFFHVKLTRLKRDKQWGAHTKQMSITDLAVRTKDEMLSSYVYAIPMIVTVGLIAYTSSKYSLLPEQIPTHWGPNGKPDAFTEKTPFSSISMLAILLILQGMMLGINGLTKRSGIKINAAKRKTSMVQQLSFRKYTSWFLFMTSALLTILFGFLQLSTIHPEIGNDWLMLALPLGFLVLILVATALYAFKVGQGGARIDVGFQEEVNDGVTNTDDDQYWKAGLFYVNRNDPSVFVEKRFGVGWTINFGNPTGYLILFGPLVFIGVITFFV